MPQNQHKHWRKLSLYNLLQTWLKCPISPFTAVTGVQIPLGTPNRLRKSFNPARMTVLTKKGRLPMRYLPFRQIVAVTALVVAGCVVVLAQAPKWGEIGKPMTQDEINSMAKDSGPSGKGLPPGRGTAKQGEQIYMTKCSMCHGIDMKGKQALPGSLDFVQGLADVAPALVGGKGEPVYGPNGPATSLSRAWYAAYPTTMWNIIAVSMPFFKPGSLSPDEVYSLVALILAKNEIIKEDMVLDRETLPKVKMPRRDDYVPANFDDILDIQKRGCWKTYAICEPMGQ
jgi:hypothetical protein